MATIRKRILKDGSNAYNVQVKFKDKGSGKTILETTTWRPDAKMSPKQEERAVQIFAEQFEKQIRNTVKGSTATAENPNITFRDFAAEWLEKVKRENSLNYYVKSKDAIDLVNGYIGGYKLRELNPAIIQNCYDKLDQLKKHTSRVIPKKEFRAVLESAGYNYMRLRYELNVQCCTLANALAGKTVSKTWSSDFSERVHIPFDKLFDEKVIEENYAYESIHKIKRTVRAILSTAKKKRLVVDNYASADYITFPKRPSHKIECMSDDDAKRFYNAIMEYPDIRYKTAMLLFLLSGFRRGEVAGLEWRDIDFEKGEISINRSVTTVKGFGMVLKEPKTETSKRTVTVPDTLMQVLKEYREWQQDRREQFGDYMQDNDFLFTQDNGERLYPSTFSGWMNKILKSANIDHYSLHSLRHTNITMQIAAGVPLVTVSARAGHARTSTTSDIYAYALRSSDREAANTIDRVFNEEKTLVKAVTSPETINSSTGDEIVLKDEFKKAKEEMKRLGFETFDEYQEYLDYIEMRKVRKKDMEMN